MSERKQLWRVLEAIIVCVIFGALWAIGGSGEFWGGQKWIRRFLATGLFSIWAFIRSGFNWYYLLQMPFMMGASTIPYGADSMAGKWFLRLISGAGNGFASSMVNIYSKKYLVAGFSFVLGIASSIAFGVYNPFHDAMKEQFVIGFCFVFLPAMTLVGKPTSPTSS